MLKLLYLVFIAPLQLTYELVLASLLWVSGDFFLSLIILSVITQLALIPLRKLASSLQQTENNIQKILAPQINKIKEKYSGAIRQEKISRLYGRYSYHPIYAIRSSFGILLQVPFLCAAYFMIKDFEMLNGVSWWLIKDLSKPDMLLMHFNALPFIMTLFNFLAIIFTKDFSHKEKRISFFVAIFFLVLLYSAPAALLIYWTSNNFISFITTVIPKPSSAKSPSSKIQITSALVSPALSTALLSFIPLFYIWSQNWFIFDGVQVAGSIFILLLFCILLYLFLYKVESFLNKKGAGLLCCLFFAILAIEITYFQNQFLLKTAIPKFGYPWWKVALSVKLSGMFLLFILFASKLTKQLNYLFLSSIFIISALWIYDVHRDSLLELNKSVESYQLKDTPNVYFLVQESVHASRVLKNVYALDAEKYDSYFLDKGFMLFENTYSSGLATLKSYSETFSMTKLSQLSRNEHDGNQIMHRITNGFLENNLFRILKANSYKTISQGMGGSLHKGELLDERDSSNFWGLNLLKLMLDPMFQASRDLDEALTPLVSKIKAPQSHAEVKIYTGSVTNKIEQAMTRHLRKSYPFFISSHGGAMHTPSWRGAYNWQQANEWVEGGKYQEAVEKGFSEVEYISDKIIKEDPGSIIIVMGDHGSWRLRDIWAKADSVQALNKNLNEAGYTLRDLADDVFSVYLAIRFPYGIEPDLPAGNQPINNLNLFRWIFYSLGASPNPLDFLEEAYSDIGDMVIVKNGEVVVP